MAKKYYAVKSGKKTGVFLTWEECKAQVEGVKGAQYKSFSTREEALAYLEGRTVPAKEKSSASKTSAIPEEKGKAIAYVDGSYRGDTQEFSCGAVLFFEGRQFSFSRKYSDPEMAPMHNVAGEIMGAVAVISHCLKEKIPALEIHHDYEGVAKWATGEWKAGKPGTQAYAGLCREAGEKLELSFIKVKGHSGDTYNDLADSLARKALGLEKKRGEKDE